MIPTKRILDYLNDIRATCFLEAQQGNTDAGGYALRIVKMLESWIMAEDKREFNPDGTPVKKNQVMGLVNDK